MHTPFRVRKLDSPALEDLSSGSLPELRDIELVLAKAFTGDIFTAVVTGHNPKDPATAHIGPFWKSTVVAGLLGGEVYVAETDDAERRIIGCAVWFGPGHTMYDTEAQQKYSLGPLMASFSEELQQWWHSQFLPRYDSFVASALGEGAKHNSWHLQTLGVDPLYQRRGAAGLLINVIVEKARSTGAMFCVEAETETNVEVYTKLGFQVMPKGKNGIHNCSDTFTGVTGDSFPMWVLMREAN
ncbi:hypothetical protein C8F04DRAFT_1088131 [Mycena alexandri]|uniref:N-acetyltransferase domain-containing protein n=1 Tax=Mycena alexandri TaxID=1745969 RepID=A0AAD6XBA4_9AGAR|nr:hypothetical protein C8F04DRAFT_1088131 [Mycena alexandri]